MKRWITAATMLWVAAAVHKIAAFAFQLAVGRRGGLAAVGVVASVATAWSLASTAVNFGLPDRALYRAAAARGEGVEPDRSAGAGHGLFLVGAALAFVGVSVMLPRLVEDPALRALARLTLAGALAQHAAAYVLSTLRGQGRPGLEALASIGSATMLASGAMYARTTTQLGFASAFAGMGYLAVLATATGRLHWLRPRLASFGLLAREAWDAAPYLAIGAGGVLLGGADVMLVRAAGDSTDAGVLQCAMAVLRGGLYGPWLFGGLMVHRMHERMRAGGGPPRVELLLCGLGLSLVAIVGAWVTLPWVLRGYDVPAERVLGPAWLALALAPCSYLALVLLPAATAVSRTRTAVSMALAIVVTFALGAALAPLFKVRGAMIAGAAGHAVLAIALFTWVLRRPASVRAPA